MGYMGFGVPVTEKKMETTSSSKVMVGTLDSLQDYLPTPERENTVSY